MHWHLSCSINYRANGSCYGNTTLYIFRVIADIFIII
nr:MAG TPA: hypothetical protein [Caudoviricetes sp.]